MITATAIVTMMWSEAVVNGKPVGRRESNSIARRLGFDNYEKLCDWLADEIDSEHRGMPWNGQLIWWEQI